MTQSRTEVEFCVASKVLVPAVEAIIKLGTSCFARRLSANLSTTIADTNSDIASNLRSLGVGKHTSS